MTIFKTAKFFLPCLCIFGGILSSGCATTAPTRSGFIDTTKPLSRTTGNVRAQVDVRKDDARLAQIRTVYIEPSILANGVVLPNSIEKKSIDLVLSEVDRQMCFKLSRHFDLAKPDARQSATNVRAAITGMQETSSAASVVSATISRFIPGPGSVRLPIGRGGLNMEASADLASNGGEAAAMAWSRGAGVAFDKGSLSQVGDAHRFAADFAETFAQLLAGPNATKRNVPQPDPCADFGARIDIGRSALGIGLGLHIPEDRSTSPFDAPVSGATNPPTATKPPGL